MYYRLKNSLASLSCLLTLSLLPMGFLSADANAVAERGGGGGHAGSFHSEGGGHAEEGYHGNAHPYDSHNYQQDHNNYNHDNYNYNHGNYNNNQFDRNAWHNDWNAGVGVGGLDVVPESEYVYPSTTQYGYPDSSSTNMNTLYDYESSTNQSSPQ